MSDYTYSKGPSGGGVFPENAADFDTSRLEPLLTSEMLVTRYLHGIQLESQMADSFGRKAKYTPDIINDIIAGAMNDLELELGIYIRPVQFKEKYEFDYNHFMSFGYLKLRHRPVSSIEQLAIVPPNGGPIFTVSQDWIETAYLVRGQINMLPWIASVNPSVANPALTASASYGGNVWLTAFSNMRWTPAHWEAIYTCGFKDNLVPRSINNLIGINAAIQILSTLGATYARTNSHSLGIDGISQSVSGPGPNIFAPRIADLKEQKEVLMGKMKALFSVKMFTSHI